LELKQEGNNSAEPGQKTACPKLFRYVKRNCYMPHATLSVLTRLTKATGCYDRRDRLFA
jgi:hypothetical protein